MTPANSMAARPAACGSSGRRRIVTLALLLAAATGAAWLPRLSSYSDQLTSIDRWSFDWPQAWRRARTSPEVILVELDERSYRALRQRPDQLWDRELHIRLLQALIRDQAGVAVFDVFFGDAGRPEVDTALAAQMQAHGKVAIAADLSALRRPGVVGATPTFPIEPMRSAAGRIGLATPVQDTDGTVRRHFLEVEGAESLPWAGARLAGAAALAGVSRSGERWMNYHGSPRDTLSRLSYADALSQPQGYFRGKFVFIGGAPSIKRPGEIADTFRVPSTAWDGQAASGVELAAVQFLNLVHGDSLVRMPPWAELGLFLTWGMLTAAVLALGTVRARGLALVGIAASIVLAGAALPEVGQVWFSWMLPLCMQIPLGLLAVAWDASPAIEAIDVERRAGPTLAVNQVDPAGGRGAAAAVAAVAMETPVVADHTLLRRVGTGAYGEVWMARNAVGILHAVKVIRRRAFESAEPFEREFRGITRFMPISRSHPGFVHVLQAGPEEVRDYFYYVMELADDAVRDEANPVENYRPTTLSSHLKAKKRLSAPECLQLGLQMTDALSHLHEARLIHRDVKPSNIIFVMGAPKLADIGLVTRVADHPREVSFLGTRGYLAPEGPGTPAADIYSLGKVLYEAYTGLDREQFPSLPTSLLETPSPGLAELNQLVLKACEVDARRRYPSAAEFHRKLVVLRDRMKAGQPGTG